LTAESNSTIKALTYFFCLLFNYSPRKIRKRITTSTAESACNGPTIRNITSTPLQGVTALWKEKWKLTSNNEAVQISPQVNSQLISHASKMIAVPGDSNSRAMWTHLKTNITKTSRGRRCATQIRDILCVWQHHAWNQTSIDCGTDIQIPTSHWNLSMLFPKRVTNQVPYYYIKPTYANSVQTKTVFYCYS
jgi:hypothetical protein